MALLLLAEIASFFLAHRLYISFLHRVVSFVTLHLQKRPKKEKVKPILVNKEDNFVTVLDQPIETPPANHFELIHPKDEFELLHSHTVSGLTTKCGVFGVFRRFGFHAIQQ